MLEGAALRDAESHEGHRLQCYIFKTRVANEAFKCRQDHWHPVKLSIVLTHELGACCTESP